MRIEAAISLRELRPFSRRPSATKEPPDGRSPGFTSGPLKARSCNSRAHPQGTLRSLPLRIARGLLLDFACAAPGFTLRGILSDIENNG